MTTLVLTGCNNQKDDTKLFEVVDSQEKIESLYIELNNDGITSWSTTQGAYPSRISLSSLYNDWKKYEEGTKESPYYAESYLNPKEEFECYYLSAQTIERIDYLIQGKYSSNFEFRNFDNYLSAYSYLFSKGDLNDKYPLYSLNKNSSKEDIYQTLGNYTLVGMSREIKCSGTITTSFMERVYFQKNEDNTVSIAYGLLKNISDQEKRLFYRYDREFAQNHKYLEYHYITLYSFKVETEDNKEVINALFGFDTYYTNQDSHYYDIANSFIISKEFDSTIDNVDYYNVKCDYSLMKGLMK